MRHLLGVLLIVALIVLALSACQPIQPIDPSAPVVESAPDEATPPLSILFIGNSLTAGITDHLEAMAAQSSPPIILNTEISLLNYAYLKMHWDAGMAQKLIEDGEWDAVVLQGDLTEIEEEDVEVFYEYVRRFDELIDEAGAQTVLYMTWECSRLPWIDTEGILAAHHEIDGQVDAAVAPVGLAWKRAMEQRPDLTMYDTDDEHANILGAYLAVSTLYAVLLDRSPVGHSYHPGDLLPDPETEENPRKRALIENLQRDYAISEEDAAFLQRIAWETVQEYNGSQ